MGNNTNWPDVIVVLFYVLGLVGGLGIGAWLVTKGHPWFALLVMLIVSTVRVKTGQG
jgi:hypothetical protein